jgi:hypothetical protein
MNRCRHPPRPLAKHRDDHFFLARMHFRPLRCSSSHALSILSFSVFNDSLGSCISRSPLCMRTNQQHSI